jgi:hypothetical protein
MRGSWSSAISLQIHSNDGPTCSRRTEGAAAAEPRKRQLEPQIRDVLKVLCQKDLTSEGIYLNVATYIRKLSSCLLMVCEAFSVRLTLNAARIYA